MCVEGEVKWGLEGVIVTVSSISYLDGEKGLLSYRGFAVEELACNSSFEEVAYLLWFGALPTSDELNWLSSELSKERDIPLEVVNIMKLFPKKTHPMDVLRSVASILSFYSEDDSISFKNAIHLTAKLPTVAAYWYRLRNDLPLIPPDRSLSHADNFLYMMFGEVPEYSDLFDKMLILHAEQEINASTFSAMVTSSTLSDIYSAVVSAIGTLKGSLHGGANEKVLEMLEEIGCIENTESYFNAMVSRKERIMGFGHRVYKTYDPRAKLMKEWLCELNEIQKVKYLDIALKLEELVLEKFKDKRIYPNVDFFSGILYNHFGIPRDYFTVLFAMARIVGWTAHVIEYRQNNRLFRPLAIYNGPVNLSYKEVKKQISKGAAS
ncbi:MAG: citrate/2-methylcitrate synthase [Synergistetes bacterium]|nr:citrate/2-methylcitrate synthase [Synergistota bacterium]MCX8128272.1 citrate/2-methylcitrate synthase [Synergistota bacterium]MDW8192585.1 citrate/2-methylcitrate synthase [Synergistota bacterium]